MGRFTLVNPILLIQINTAHGYMTRLILVLVSIHFFTITKAQPPLCLPKVALTNQIDMRAEELNNFLHLDKYKIIFFGEQHNDRFDPEIKYHLITDLNKRTGLRHVFLEISFSSAWKINEYLRTGDTTYLYNPAWPQRFRTNTSLWVRLYEYNRGLPDEQKLVIHGVDFETTGIFHTLKKLSPTGKDVPEALKPVMDTIETHLSDPPLKMWDMVDGKFILYDNSAFTSTLRYVQAQFLAYPDATKKYFGDNYPVVDNISKNDGRVEVKAKRRNSTMFDAMQRIVNEQKIERFIGFFGGQHTTYTVGNSLANEAAGLKGFGKSDILNIAEFAYNVNSKDTAYRDKHFHEIVALNGSCGATILPAHAVPGYKKHADFVVVTDVSR